MLEAPSLCQRNVRSAIGLANWDSSGLHNGYTCAARPRRPGGEVSAGLNQERRLS